MKCANHPNAPAIDNCVSCTIPLCGMCASFTDAGVLCEKCVEVHETERKVEAEAARHEKTEEPKIIETPDEEVPVGPVRKESNPAVLQVGIIAICAVIVIARATVFSPQQQSMEQQTTAIELNLVSLAQCMVTFQQIGAGLAAGGEPDTSLLCPDSPQPNRILRRGDDVIVEHPQPEYYGYTSLTVSRSNPVPVLGPPLPQG